MKKIIIVSGDPNSINSEIIFKSWKKINKSIKKSIYVISNFNLLKSQFKKLRYKIQIVKVKSINEKEDKSDLKIIDVKLNYKNSFKVPNKLSSDFIIKSLNIAHKLSKNKNISGIINCSINKNLLKKSKIGVTEFFVSKCGLKYSS